MGIWGECGKFVRDRRGQFRGMGNAGRVGLRAVGRLVTNGH